MTEFSNSLRNLRRNALCNNWLMNGHCQRGETCQYAHGIYALRLTQNESEKYNINKDGVVTFSSNGIVCRFFQRGECSKGAQCKFVHENGSQSVSYGDEHCKRLNNALKLTKELTRSTSISSSEDEEEKLSHYAGKIRIGNERAEVEEEQSVQLIVLTSNKSGLSFKIARNKPLSGLRQKVSEWLKIKPSEVGLVFNAKMVTDNQTADGLKLRNNDCIQSITIVNCSEQL